MQESYERVRKCAKVKGRVELKIEKSKDPKGPVPLEPAITRDQFSRATRAGRGQSWIFPAI